MGNEAAISHDAAAGRLAAALRLYVGRGKLYSVEMVADAAEVSPSAVEKAMAGQYTFGLAATLRLFAVLGPAFVNHLIEPAGLTGVRRLDPVAKEAAGVMADMAAGVASFADKLRDGRLDHVEKAELRQTLPRLVSELQDFLAALGRDAG